MGPVAEAKAVLGQPIFDREQEARVLSVAAQDGAARAWPWRPTNALWPHRWPRKGDTNALDAAPIPAGLPGGRPSGPARPAPRHRRHHRGAADDPPPSPTPAVRQREAFREALGAALQAQGAQDREISALADAALALRFEALAPEGLAALKAQGTLRVGTTGDYAPFSYRTAEGALAGIDIDLAQAFAESLGLKLELVETSWPTLTADLQRGAFDLALSGISRP